jgi:3'-5' exonuclease
MLEQIKFENILFLDIETVPQFPIYEEVPEDLRSLWDLKTHQFNREGSSPDKLYERAGIYAEFGKIICISTGIISKNKEGKTEFRIKSFSGDDEELILKDFASLLNKFYNQPKHLLCAHNGKEFDFPFISRRLLLNGIKIPKILQLAGKKPWEIPHLDTMELWKFGDYKHYSSLNLLATVFNITTPKTDISGKDVSRVYYQDRNLKRIVEYCQKDVLTVAQIFLKYRGDNLIDEQEVKITS